MKSSPVIRSIVSLFLLCVFALGITPKQVLHDALTNHFHTPLKEKPGALVNKDRFNCDDENLVAESPFVSADSAFTVPVPATFSLISNEHVTSYSFLHPFFFELRGPPSVA